MKIKVRNCQQINEFRIISRINYLFPIAVGSPDKKKSTALKVIKRRAPDPIIDAADISISRPIVTKNDHSKGMIPPPPIKIQMSTPSGLVSKPEPSHIVCPSSPKAIIDRPPSPSSLSPLKSTSPSSKPLDLINSPFAPQSMGSLTSSSESLVKPGKSASGANQASVSPSALRPPGRKVTNVTTIKRQPKTGWL